MAYIGNSPGQATQRVTTTFTATQGQTNFNPVSGYTPGYADVYLNGIKLVDNEDYTATDGVTVVLSQAATADDIVEILAYIPRGLTDGYTKAEADAKYTTQENFTSTGIDDNATSTKFTVNNNGIDVTGTVTADGLTVLGTTEDYKLRVGYDATRYYDIYRSTAGFGELVFNGSQATYNGYIFTGADGHKLKIANNGDVHFYEDTGTTAKLTWDSSAENILSTGTPLDGSMYRGSHGTTLIGMGIGNNETYKHNYLGTDEAGLWINDTSKAVDMKFSLRSSGDFVFRSGNNPNEKMRINSNGNVGIGVSAPETPLAIGHASHGVGAGYTGANIPRQAGIYTSTAEDGQYGSLVLKSRTDYSVYSIYMQTADSNNTPQTRLKINNNGAVQTPDQPHIFGTPGNGTVGGSGIADRFAVRTSRGGLSFSNSRITVPVAGVYSITFQTITSSGTGRVDTRIKINGNITTNGLSADNGTGFRQRTHALNIYLNVNDYIQFESYDYYDDGNAFDEWQTASVTLLG